MLREIESVSVKSTIKDDFIKTFIIGRKYLLRDAKISIQSIYDNKGLKKTGKACDLREYFDLKEIKITDPITKKVSKGVEILRIKE